MDVTIHGGFDTGMTQQLLQYFRHDTALNGPCGIGVSQSVHSSLYILRYIFRPFSGRCLCRILCLLGFFPFSELLSCVQET